ncbi:MAG: hypothetical protein H7256_01600 [Bdellovibrio sp.]|nr:hypothetical protein [Bdellovibrio sp.]
MEAQTNTPVRISSKFTLATFTIAPAFGLIIGYVIASRTLYAWWGILIALAVAAYAIFFAVNIASGTLQDDVITMKKPLGPRCIVRPTDILRVRKFRSRRHNYFFFSCINHSFMIVSPLWGPGREALETIYNLKKKQA